MLVKYGDGKITSIIEEEDLDETQKITAKEIAKNIQKNKNTVIVPKEEKNN